VHWGAAVARVEEAPIEGVREVEPGFYSVRSEPEPQGPIGRAWVAIRHLLLGDPLPSRLERAERLGMFAALAVLGADSIASSVYGPEEMMRMLAQAGPGAVALALPIGVCIVGLLAILAVSYQQTIRSYPDGAGGYIVASDNLGPLVGLVAAGALLVDYTLDVAVSIATGIQSLTSAVPALAPGKVWLALLALAIITVANLRGIRTAGALLSAPVHVYIVATLGVLAFGVFRWATGTLPDYTPPESAAQLLAQPTEAVGLLLLLRAFSSGAVALTGIEAISNGVPYFKPTETTNARRTLVVMAVVFAALFLGIAFLAGQLGVVADPDEVETVLSQITRTLVGRGPVYLLVQAAAILLLILAADTGFADFPRLLAMLARDGYLPQAFAARGLRLSFSNGIVLVAVISAVLIVAFHASVAGLVPLFTVGAFLTFTFSQAGMVRHWWRRREPGWHWRMAVNAVGAATTTVVLAVVLVSKFASGAWIVVLVLPILVLTLRAVGQHQHRLEANVQIGADQARAWVASVAEHTQHVALIPVGAPDRIALHAVALARTLLTPSAIQAVHVTDDHEAGRQAVAEWNAARVGVPMVVLESPYRATAEALLRYIDLLQAEHGPGAVVTVVLPETLPTRWWHPLLHNYLAWRLKWALLFRPGACVLSVPYFVRD
jgi:amino acid transporter